MSPAPRGQGQVIDRFRRARRDREIAVVEGFHALKHALRFDAELLEVLCDEPAALERLVGELAPDIGERLIQLAQPVAPETFAQLAPRAPRTGVVALAKRRDEDLAALLADPRRAPIVLLEEPRDLNNVGACIRVAAAAEAAGVVVTGRHDPWHADAIRGAAGLHFALPVVWSQTMPEDAGARPLIALDPEGEPFDPNALAPRALLAFGSERQGLSAPLLARATARLRLPMRSGVSSLNLATSVAATLFALRLSASGQTAATGRSVAG
ncbi:MAG TPA: TrmH family RNA methyltransferase [Solirubrobacteraceae bacterium]|jgi:tRNA G18 (ribose-2'-O)-methylase SpoU